MPRPSRREDLLDAAVAVIRRDGARALTLDAVARDLGDEPLAGYVRACDLEAAGPGRAASEFGLLAALVEEPQVLEAVRARYATWMGRLLGRTGIPAAGGPSGLGADGRGSGALLGPAPPAGEDRRRGVAGLLALAGSPP